MRSLALAFAIAVWPAHVLAAPAYYCPWASTVVRFSFSDTAVDLDYAIYPGTRKLTAVTAPHPVFPGKTVTWFWQYDGDYRYDFYFDEQLKMLINERQSVTKGTVSKQSGYCFTVE